MYDLKKSDAFLAIVAVKQANKGQKCSAESVEPRGCSRGRFVKAEGHAPGGQKRVIMSQGADRIRQAVKRNPKECLVSLFHHITVPVLSEAFYSLKSDVAAGCGRRDSGRCTQKGLGDRLTDLHGRLHRGGSVHERWRVRRVEIPCKPDGGKRPLGIATLEDKIVQPGGDGHDFGTDSTNRSFSGLHYGFRPGRGAHIRA